MRQLRRYRLGPFHIGSELDIPELAQRHDKEPPNVTIRLGEVPERIENVVVNETRWWASRTEYLQRVPDVANFLVREGRHILVEPAPESLPGDVRAYLLAPIFSALCFQAGFYALHASAVLTPRGVIAFLGHSGAGKSTLAAFLERRGYSIVSDDLCLLDKSIKEGADPVVIPVAPALKLWPSALEQLGTRTDGLPQVWSREEKYRMRLEEPERCSPLAAIVSLVWNDKANSEPMMSPIAGVEAITALMGYMHFEYIMKATGRQAECFAVCAHLLRSVPAFTLRRPRNFERIGDAVQLIEQVISDPSADPG